MDTEHLPSPLPILPETALAIVPVRSMVLFPGVIIPINIGRAMSIAAAQFALQSETPLGIVMQRNPGLDQPTLADLHGIGSVATVMRYISGPEGAHHIVCQGEQRFRILEPLTGLPFLAAHVERITEQEPQGTLVDARMLQIKTMMTEILELLPQTPSELLNTLQQMTSGGVLCDLVASFMDLTAEEKQDILETLDVLKRMERITTLLQHRIEVLRISNELNQQTQQSMSERQREFVLREQMKTIQRELGETDSRPEDIDELRQAIARAKMPADVEAQTYRELKRLERMGDASGEYPMLRNYIECLIELPWSVETEDSLDLTEARRVLDTDHFGLDKVKQRILEYLAVHKLNPGGKSPILCFAGPPGVGKTSLGQSIARAMGRKFVRASLGGVHDEAEIRGHRRTYIGALPGNIIQSIRKAGARNCVMLLDEIDKLGSSYQGDPAAALLEVLDPEQNSSFRDNYLAVPFDLSHVMFIATANLLDSIPSALRDRMEVISLPGYTAQEKSQIARRYLVDKQRISCGLSINQCVIDDDAITAVIRDYTREAGVRNLEREIGSVFRHAAVRIANAEIERLAVGQPQLQAILGSPRYENEVAMRTSLPGVATGLAGTQAGGDILFIEANRTPGSGKLILTGQLGDVMKESAQAALTLAKSRSATLGLAADYFDKSDIHIHVPAGATPKDGPSAGVAMFIALVSLLCGRPVRSDTSMSGEISLRGLVLPVGGIKEKVLAALAAGLSRILLPARNRKELDDIPADARDKLQFVWLETVDDALREALGN
jgi:ATP-dependent Lon protease